jgi:hypothetical protein
MASVSFTIFLVAFICQNQTIFNSTASFQNVRIFGVIVAFADDIRGAQLELVRKRGGARPLDIFGVVVRTGVLAAHYVYFVEAFGVAADAGELTWC